MSSERKIMIIGEAEAMPWRWGKSVERLRRWFGVKTFEELEAMALLENIARMRNVAWVDFEHVEILRALASTKDHVFLVGKRAQRAIAGDEAGEGMLWTSGKYHGLPHPSGRNRQLNGVDDALIASFVLGAIQSRERR